MWLHYTEYGKPCLLNLNTVAKITIDDSKKVIVFDGPQQPIASEGQDWATVDIIEFGSEGLARQQYGAIYMALKMRTGVLDLGEVIEIKN